MFCLYRKTSNLAARSWFEFSSWIPHSQLVNYFQVICRSERTFKPALKKYFSAGYGTLTTLNILIPKYTNLYGTLFDRLHATNTSQQDAARPWGQKQAKGKSMLIHFSCLYLSALAACRLTKNVSCKEKTNELSTTTLTCNYTLKCFVPAHC